MEKSDRDAITLYLRHGCIPAPYSIYKGIKKLPPATLLSVRHEEQSGSLLRYWSLKDVAERGKENRFQGSEEDAIEQLDGLLRDAIKIRMISDVPLVRFCPVAWIHQQSLH